MDGDTSSGEPRRRGHQSNRKGLTVARKAQLRFEAAGLDVSYFVGTIDRNRRLLHRLSPRCETIAEARQWRTLARLGHPTAVILREVLSRDVELIP